MSPGRPEALGRRHRRLGVAAGTATLGALGLLLMPMQEGAEFQRLLNAAHVPGFGLLAWLWAEGGLVRGWPKARRLAIVAPAGLALALLSEGLQALIPGRHADLADVLRNGSGIALGLGVHLLWPGLAARPERQTPTP